MNRSTILAAMLTSSFSLVPSAAQEGGALDFNPNDFVVEGKVQKPEVVVVISRENLDKGFQIVLKESFLDRIVEATAEPPF